MTAPTLDKGRVKELRGALETKTKRLQELSDSFKIDTDGNIEISTEQGTEFKKLMGEAKDIRGLMEAEQGLGELRQWMDSPEGKSVAAEHASTVQRGGLERKSLADAFMESESFRSQQKATRPVIQFEMDGAINPEIKAIYGGSQTPTGGALTVPGLGHVDNIGIREMKLRSQHVRDLFPKRTTTATQIISVRETGFTNNAAQISVRLADNSGFTTKPESQLSLVPVTYNIARVAHWIKAHKDILSDEPRLKDFINMRMTDGILFAEDRDILFGAGGSERVTGIMNTPGIQVYAGQAADKWTKQLRRAATRAMLANYDPTGVILHPLDWEELELEETLDGHYRIAINVAVGGTKRLWSMDIVATSAMTQGNYLLGNFNMGAQIFDREQVNVQISTENEADFIQNLVTVRAEERLAVVVDRPESFVAGTLTAYVAPA
jgi:HK97 family phage major capsid protein